MLLASDLDDLHDVARSPVTARVAWWRAAVDADLTAMPMLIVRKGASSALDAATFLMLREEQDRPMRRLTTARPHSDDVWEVAARSTRAERALAAELAEVITGLETPWRLELTGLRDGTAVLDVLAARLPHAQVLPASPVPRVRFARGENMASLLRASARAGLARSARRIANDGLHEEIRFEDQPAPLLEMQSEIEAVHRARDHDAGRLSDLDDEAGLRFWRSVYAHHAINGELEVATLRLDDHLAAYVVAFVDSPAYRVFDGRFAPRYRRYSPGRRLESAVLDRASRDPSVHELDWMSSVAPEQLIAATGAQSRWTLLARSPSPTRDALALATAAES